MVTETDGFKHLLKYACHSSNNNEKYYPFAEHPKFKFWAYDRLRRHRSLGQTKVYFKQNAQDANLTMTELQELLKTGEGERLMQRMSPYAANITGSDAYWYQRRSELQATFEQKKPATVFFTFSYADNHWHDLHKLMPGKLENKLNLPNIESK